MAYDVTRVMTAFYGEQLHPSAKREQKKDVSTELASTLFQELYFLRVSFGMMLWEDVLLNAPPGVNKSPITASFRMDERRKGKKDPSSSSVGGVGAGDGETGGDEAESFDKAKLAKWQDQCGFALAVLKLPSLHDPALNTTHLAFWRPLLLVSQLAVDLTTTATQAKAMSILSPVIYITCLHLCAVLNGSSASSQAPNSPSAPVSAAVNGSDVTTAAAGGMTGAVSSAGIIANGNNGSAISLTRLMSLGVTQMIVTVNGQPMQIDAGQLIPKYILMVKEASGGTLPGLEPNPTSIAVDQSQAELYVLVNKLVLSYSTASAKFAQMV